MKSLPPVLSMLGSDCGVISEVRGNADAGHGTTLIIDKKVKIAIRLY
jgi:hypothetical protein